MTGHTDRTATRDVERALVQLAGHDLFRRNAFRVTGLAPEATTRQVRRAREESLGRFGVRPEGSPHAPLPPSDDPEELRAAFEVLRDPVARLVHELLWVADGTDGERTRAVRDLCEALERTTADGTVLTETAWDQWKRGLKALSSLLTSPAVREHLRARAEASDDPRLTVAVVREIRQRVPAHVAGVAVGFAARQARTAPGTAERLVRVVRSAAFDTADLNRALRRAAEPETERVEEACEKARAADAEAAGVTTARTLTNTAREPLRALDALLGADDDVVRGCRDDVALAANNCLVRHFNANPDRSSEVRLTLLREAQDLATSQSTRDLIERNVDAMKEALAYEALKESLADRRDRYRRGGAGPSGASGRPTAVGDRGPRRVVLRGCLYPLAVGGIGIWVGTDFAVDVVGVEMPGALVPGAFFGLIAIGMLAGLREIVRAVVSAVRDR